MDRVRGLIGPRSVVVDVPADLPMVEVDASAIERVIANLLHNALKYAPSDSYIGLTGRAIDGWLELRVEDDGPGIPARHREQIFHRFFRGRDAEASGRPGHGLGLAICLSIVSAHGGRIWADARPGGGTRFTVALPLTPANPWPDVSGQHHPREANERQREHRAYRGPGAPNHRAVHRQYHLNSDSTPSTRVADPGVLQE
jgi:two-component system sensor histidine kinase KdpD